MIGNLQNNNCLLLQGPMGPFFRRLDRALRTQGAHVYRICFNGGDFFYANKGNSTCYTKPPDQWHDYLSRFVKRYRIHKIFLYGDCRYYHQVATRVASRFGIEVFVFEEGYVRPHYITLEKGGVNYRSSMPKDADSYRLNTKKTPAEDGLTDRETRVTHPLQKWTVYAILYYLFMRLYSWHFPHYRHHRCDSVLKEAAFGMRNYWRKFGARAADEDVEERIKRELHKKFFFVPLQTIGDTQISCHSPFADMKAFIQVVIRSFSNHAPEDVFLIIKHHPLDRGRVEYDDHICRLAQKSGVSERVLSVHDVHLPTCLENAIGTVTINSTVGISSLTHDTPTIVLGKSVYDIEGMTCKGMPLKRFWTDYQKPDSDLFKKFRNSLVEKTQIVGSFYSGFPEKLRGRS